VRVQTDISVLGNNECPPQERRALGYCIIEVGHRLENTQGGVPFLLTRPVATFEFNQSWLAGHQIPVRRGASVRLRKDSTSGQVQASTWRHFLL